MRKIQFFSQVFLGLVFLASCSSNKGEVSPIKKDITETVFASGSLEAEDQYQLIAQTEGYIEDMFFDEGDSIKLGQELARIENIAFDANRTASNEQLRIAEFNLTANAPAIQEAKANLDYALTKKEQDERQVQRYRELYKKESVSALELENIELTYEQSVANVKALEKRLNLLKQQAKQSEISQRAQQDIANYNSAFNNLKALSDGRIVKRYKQRGDYVRKGDVIFSIANESTIIGKLNVDESSVEKLKIGQEGVVKLNTNNSKLYKVKLTKINPMYDDASQSFLCEVVFLEPLDFKVLGTRLEANINVAFKQNALLIPRQYLSYSNTVQVKGEETERKVDVGIKSTEWVEVTNGLAITDILIPLKK